MCILQKYTKTAIGSKGFTVLIIRQALTIAYGLAAIRWQTTVMAAKVAMLSAQVFAAPLRGVAYLPSGLIRENGA